ncbi:MAG: methylated-DNA--[protein]-cysteine S-methyltransferase [Kofleriaceae bacterium]
MIGLALFDTAIGRCGIAWAEHAIAGVQLPEVDERETRSRLARRFTEVQDATPAAHAQRAIDAIIALLRGEPVDLAPITLDLSGVPAFNQRVYQVTRTIPPGCTLTYGDIASRLGSAGSARAIGQALGRNPVPIIVPCHRVLAAGGKLGGFSAHGGGSTKQRMLAIECGNGPLFR